MLVPMVLANRDKAFTHRAGLHRLLGAGRAAGLRHRLLLLRDDRRLGGEDLRPAGRAWRRSAPASQQYGIWIILIKGLTPIPYKLVTIASGAAHFDLFTFVWASIVTRGVRFFARGSVAVEVRRADPRFHREAADARDLAVPDRAGRRLRRLSLSVLSDRPWPCRNALPLPSQLGLLAALGSGALLGGAYYFQYVVGLAPCDLCLLQRWPHMVAIAAGPGGTRRLRLAAARPGAGADGDHGAARHRGHRRLPCRRRVSLVAGPAGLLGQRAARPLARAAQEIPVRRQDGALRRDGLGDVGHLDGRLERHPLGRPGVRAGLRRGALGEVGAHEDRRHPQSRRSRGPRAGRAHHPRRPGRRIRRRAHLPGPARGPALDRPRQRRGRPQDRRHGAGRARAQQGVRPPAGRAPRAADRAVAAVERGGLRAGRGDGADGRQGGDGLHGGDRGDDRRALCRPGRRAGRRRGRAARAPSRSSAPRRSSTRTSARLRRRAGAGLRGADAAIKAGSRLAIWLSTRI